MTSVPTWPLLLLLCLRLRTDFYATTTVISYFNCSYSSVLPLNLAFRSSWYTGICISTSQFWQCWVAVLGWRCPSKWVLRYTWMSADLKIRIARINTQLVDGESGSSCWRGQDKSTEGIGLLGGLCFHWWHWHKENKVLGMLLEGNDFRRDKWPIYLLRCTRHYQWKKIILLVHHNLHWQYLMRKILNFVLLQWATLPSCSSPIWLYFQCLSRCLMTSASPHVLSGWPFMCMSS